MKEKVPPKLQRVGNFDRTITFYLYLSGDKADAEVISEIAAMLKDNPMITGLDLYDNQIGEAGTRRLATILKGNNTLRSLLLKKNRIGDAGVVP